MSILYSLLGFALMLGVLVFVHEWGHYIVARLFNVKVMRFSIGFGPVIARFQRGETEWALSAIPLGGYVKMLDEREQPVSSAERDRAFSALAPWKRILIVLAGPLINLLFAWVLFALVYWVGYDSIRPVISEQQRPDVPIVLSHVDATPVWSWGDVQTQVMKAALQGAPTQLTLQGKIWPDWQPWQKWVTLETFDIDQGLYAWLASQGLQPASPPMLPRVGQVMPDSPAEQAGLRAGDMILAVNDRPVSSWQALVAMIAQYPHKQVILQVSRQGVVLELPVTIGVHPDKRGEVKGFLGVGVDVAEAVPPEFKSHVAYALPQALEKGLQRGMDMLSMTLDVMMKMLTGQASLQNLSGPVSIAQFSGQALAQGWVSFVLLMALLSLSLGVLNLLPIPMLDGGHIVMDLYAWIRGKPLPETIQNGAYKLGLAVLLFLTFLALTNDMVRLLHD